MTRKSEAAEKPQLNYVLKVSDRQLTILRDALELYDRLLIGQIDSFLWNLYSRKRDVEIDHDRFTAACRELKAIVFPELMWNESYSVGWREKDGGQQAAQISYEMEATIRYRLWKMRNNPDEGYTTSSSPPLHYSDQPFITLEKIVPRSEENILSTAPDFMLRLIETIEEQGCVRLADGAEGIPRKIEVSSEEGTVVTVSVDDEFGKREVSLEEIERIVFIG